jgi:chromatin modification-related protein EAF6
MEDSKIDWHARINEVARRRIDVKSELAQIEKQIYDLEGGYFEETRDFGNVFKGWKDYLSTTKVKGLKRAITEEERFFSLSSVTSPAAKKIDQAQKKQTTSASEETN